MQLSRQFEESCHNAFKEGKIQGFMHTDNGQEAIPALIADAIKLKDKKYSYYRVCHKNQKPTTPNVAIR